MKFRFILLVFLLALIVTLVALFDDAFEPLDFILQCLHAIVSGSLRSLESELAFLAGNKASWTLVFKVPGKTLAQLQL